MVGASNVRPGNGRAIRALIRLTPAKEIGAAHANACACSLATVKRRIAVADAHVRAHVELDDSKVKKTHSSRIHSTQERS
ncbi:MAG: hypothetical protein NVS3B20_23820 [Polyangiales bacterium]